jgi:opacity protein-like surface antigen
MRKEFVLAVIGFLTCAASLRGQDEITGYEVGPYVAWQDWKAKGFEIGTPQSATRVNADFRYRDHVAYGIRANFLSHGHNGGELSYSYQQNTATITRPSVTPLALKGNVQHVFYNQIFYPVRYGRAILPYFTGGLGIAFYQVNEEARLRAADPIVNGVSNLRSTDKEFAFNYGAGVKANIVEHFGIRADFRQIISAMPDYGLPERSTNPAQFVFPVGGKLQNYEYSFGVYFRAVSTGFK